MHGNYVRDKKLESGTRNWHENYVRTQELESGTINSQEPGTDMGTIEETNFKRNK